MTDSNGQFIPTTSPELRFSQDFNAESASLPLLYDELPIAVKESLDDVAACVLDPNSGKVIVTGEAFAGKTFLIEQFAHNKAHYEALTDMGEIRFVRVTLTQANLVNDYLPNKWSDYVTVVSNTFGINPANIIFVTESVYAAAGITELGGKVIFECSESTLESLHRAEEQGSTKTWSSWSVVDASSVALPKKDLVTILSRAHLETLNGRFPTIGLKPKHVQMFVNYFIREGGLAMPADQVSRVTPATSTVFPTGLWARFLSRLATIMAFAATAKNAKGHVVFSRALQLTFEEASGAVLAYVGGDETYELDPAASSLIQAIRNAHPGAQVQVIDSSSLKMPTPEREVEETGPRGGLNVFSDIKTLEARIASRVLGQDDAVKAVVSGMKIPASGLNNETKPVRSLLLLGPTGVGKTEMAQTLARELMEEELPLVRIDMSEFGQAHEVARLFGAPPGYKGFEAGGVLTNAVAQDPRSIILLDEIEKAHPDVWDAFLQILDAGRMTDGAGTVVDFTKTVVIMTSNLGAAEADRPKVGFLTAGSETAANNDRQSIVMSELQKAFKPELINRLDQIILFNRLSEDVILDVVAKEINAIRIPVERQGHRLAKPTDKVLKHLASLSDTSKYGAREIQRVVSRELFEKLADAMIEAEGPQDLKLRFVKGAIKVDSSTIV